MLVPLQCGGAGSVAVRRCWFRCSAAVLVPLRLWLDVRVRTVVAWAAAVCKGLGTRGGDHDEGTWNTFLNYEQATYLDLLVLAILTHEDKLLEAVRRPCLCIDDARLPL